MLHKTVYEYMHAMQVKRFNLVAAGLITGLFDIPRESRHLRTGPAELCQGCLQGDGVLGVTEPGTQVRIK